MKMKLLRHTPCAVGLNVILKLLIVILLCGQGHANNMAKLDGCCDIAKNVCGKPGGASSPCTMASINEELAIGQAITNFTGSDDDGDTLTYSIFSPAEALQLFEMKKITSTTSALVVKSRIDFEALGNALVAMKYHISDGHNSPVQLDFFVHVKDINDNTPDFMDLPYRCSVKENLDKANCTGIRIRDRDQTRSDPTVTASGTNFPSSMYEMKLVEGPIFVLKTVEWKFNMEIQKPLDYEKDRIFQLTLRAEDTGGFNSTADLVLYVQDEPDQPPIFTRQPYDRKVAENTGIGAKIVQIVARDGDSGINNRISYHLDAGDAFSDLFNLDNETGWLTVAKNIDRENEAIRKKFSLLELHVVAKELSAAAQPKNMSESSVVVHITVEDVNDYVPTFGATKYVGTLVENTQKDVAVSLTPEVVCKDLDSISNAEFNLTVEVGGKESDTFYVTPKVAKELATVVVRVKDPTKLDFEKTKQMSFQIVAQETQSPFRKAHADVTVNITDANDNFPKFNSSIYTFKVPENSDINTKVGQVFASDGDIDSDVFGKVTYTLEGSSKFYINNATGEIFVAVNGAADPNILDRDNFGGASYAMNVKAQDGGKLTAYAQVQIHLSDKNDKAPIFLPTSIYYAALVENKKTFERGVTVRATDQDAPPDNNNVTYSIVAGNYGSHFSVDPLSGVLSVEKAVDLEDLPSEMENSNVFRLTVQAKDQGDPPLASNGTVVVTVEDVNDNPPNFTQQVYKVTINETTAPNTEVIQVNATDADRSGPVFYRIGSGAADKFAIDGVSGVLRVEDRAKLDVATYNISVVAIDRGSPSKSSSALVSVTVTDVNNVGPRFPADSFTRVVEENNEANSELFAYPATDPDSDAALVYTIMKDQMTGKSGSTPVNRSVYINLFSVTNKGGIVATGVLDREAVDTITIPIMVNDTNAKIQTPPQTATTTIIIVVSDQNDESPKFQLPSGKDHFSVQVLESLTPPADTSLTVQAVDKDKNEMVRYTLQDSTNHFQINSVSGVIRLVKPLDYETQKRIEMTVFAADTGGHRVNATVIATVVDANDNNPNFTVFQSVVNVSEYAKPGDVITTVKAEDLDSGRYGAVTYFLTADGGGKFAINATTGEVSLKGSLDRDVPGGSSYRLAVEARDNVGGSSYQGKASQLMEVKVTDENDNPPKFQQATYSFLDLKENYGENVKIDEIAAVDPDEGDNSKLTYSLQPPATGSQEALNLFKVETIKHQGSYRAVVKTKTTLKNKVGDHDAILVATDAGTPPKNGSATLRFRVVDVNDFTPVFVSPNTSDSLVLDLKESVINDNLYTAKATDTDKGSNGAVRYRLSSSSGDHESFIIDSTTGVLRNTKKLDREVKTLYRFQIIAYDLGSPSLSSSVTIKVNILDVDDHPPVFPSTYKVQVLTLPEGEGLTDMATATVRGRLIGNVGKASDADTGSNAVICYFIVSAGHQDLFYLNKTTGDLYAIVEFDRETTPEYTLTIKAVSKAQCDTNDFVWKPKSTARRLLYLTNEIKYSDADATLAKITVKVGDKNDNKPVFDRKFFFDGVTKDSPPLTEIINFKLFVTDKDSGKNSKHTYAIDGPIDITQPLKRQLEEKKLINVLFLNETSGVLMTGKKIYFQDNMQGYFRFKVKVTDVSPTSSDTASVTVYLLNASQRVVVVFRDSPVNVGKIAKPFADFISNITQLTVNVDNIVTHKKENGQAESSMTDMYIHAYDPKTHRLIPATELIKILDNKWKSLRTLYNNYNVVEVKNPKPTTTTSGTEILRIALILCACVLGLLVLITCVALWTCRRMYRRKLKAATTVAFGPDSGLHSTPMPGTNRYTYEGSNPIWMSQYENYAMKEDIPSEKDRDSLDENAFVTRPKSRENFDEQEVVLQLNEESDDEGRPRSTTDTQNGLVPLDAAIDSLEMQRKGSQQMLVNSDAAASPTHRFNGNLPATAI